MVEQKWIALSNTTLGQLVATINTSVIIVALPPIFEGIGLNPLSPGSFSYLLWVIMSYMIVISVLLVTVGKLSDMFGRVRLFNLGFLVFTVASVLLYLTPGRGDTGALEIIIFRIIQAVGGSFIMANSFAIITDNFNPNERGFAISINSVASVSGVSIGIVLGGILSVVYWRDVFLLSVPLGIFGTIWSYLKLKETSPRKKQRIDIAGNILFGSGLVIFLLGVTYGITPFRNSPMGWENPLVILALASGVILLVVFVAWETRADHPMFNLRLFRTRGFSIGSFTGFISAMGMMGLLYMLTLLFQGVWLPLHGVPFSITPLWAGIYMLPMTVSMGLFGILAGRISDRYGQRMLTVIGLLISALSLLGLTLLPYNFSYMRMGMLITIFGAGYGLFNSPNISAVMNSVPASDRGSASGMLNNMRNTGYVASMGVFFSILIAGLATNLPLHMTSALNSVGATALVPYLSGMPPTEAIFGAFLGINPAEAIISAIPHLPASIPASTVSLLEGNTWFPGVLAPSFMRSLDTVFYVISAITIFGSIVSFFRNEGKQSKVDDVEKNPDGSPSPK
ncbi:MAG: MFS transporter [Candidatus Thermoplasmatota archaeon]|nr:MFS transporter [Candidatus Thermoplasmatota archaeon]